MVFPVVGGDGKPTGYEIENSLRFDNPDDPNLSTTFSSAGNRRTFTISAWIKRKPQRTNFCWFYRKIY